MPRVIYVEHGGTVHETEVAEGTSLMQGAVDNLVAGILADCGGACACATCHVYVEEAWLEKSGVPDEQEQAMLDVVMERAPNSRLSCQMKMSAALDGIVLRLPASQE